MLRTQTSHMVVAFGAGALLTLVLIDVQNRIIMNLTNSQRLAPSKPLESRIDPNCSCVDPATNKEYNFCYSFNSTNHGARFKCAALPYLKQLGLLSVLSSNQRSTSSFTLNVSQNPPILTGANDNHYDEMRHAIGSTQRAFPQNRLIVYNFGLSESRLSELRSFCHIEIRFFNFSRWPKEVRSMYTYKWKPIIYALSVNEFPDGFWWIDTSIRWNHNKVDYLYDHIRQGRRAPYVLIEYTGHSVFATTNPGVYKYIPTDTDQLKKMGMFSGGFAFIVRNAITLNVLKWLVLCALTSDCLTPPGSTLSCAFANDRWNRYARCHRFDQSVMNLLLANHFQFIQHAFTTAADLEQGKFAVVRRTDSGPEPIFITNDSCVKNDKHNAISKFGN